MKNAEEVMQILEAYDLAGTLRGAAALAGCDHKTVAHWVRQRELAGGMPAAERCEPAVGDFAGKIDELVEPWSPSNDFYNELTDQDTRSRQLDGVRPR